MIATGLDRLLEEPTVLRGRRFGLLAHGASVSAALEPAHVALARAGVRPAALFAAEHGFYGVEQDMVPASAGRDPWTGAPILSLYGDSEASLRPDPRAFADLDLLLIDLQDVGARYYTFAATAVWAAEAAAAAGCAVWVLDRPNPLGGVVVEGNLPEVGFESFVGAFALPVRHGLTLGEIVLREARARGFGERLEVWTLRGWRRSMLWPDTGLQWIAPSPNMPGFTTAAVYPGSCLIEATELSEGRGTTRPFRLIGAPDLDPRGFAERLAAAALPGVAFVPTYFRPQHQKHCGAVCGGVELVVTEPSRLSPYRLGVELLAALAELRPAALRWRRAPYEFRAERPAIDLLTGSAACRRGLETGRGLGDWIASWRADETRFRDERRRWLLYPDEERA